MANGNLQSPIPAINGTCPDGYLYDSVNDQCVLPTSPPITTSATGVTLPDVDPKNAGELTGLGTQNSGLAERFALAHWHTIRRFVKGTPQTGGGGIQSDGSWLGDMA